MQFEGMEALVEGYPTIVVGPPGHQVDLHNDADLREISLSLIESSVLFIWTVRQAAWKRPETPETADRQPAAGVTLRFSGVRSVTMSGKFEPSLDGNSSIEFIEYHRTALGVGRVRVVFEHSLELELVASRCEMLAMR
jgi:hypothetical protein